MILIIFLVILSIFIYIKAIKPFNYWTERGIKQRKQVYLFGDTAKLLFKQENFFQSVINIYNAFPDERYLGIYQMTLPILVLRDPELFKQVAIKEFDHFTDHRPILPDGVDPVWSRNLFSLKGKQWKDMRSTLSPSFTSSKIKMIYSLMNECATNYVNHFSKLNQASNDIELKDVCTRYTNDMIATVAFGIKFNSINDKENDFYTTGHKLTHLPAWRNFIFFAYAVAPGICKKLGLNPFPRSISDFFKSIVSDTIKAREEQGITRPDMLQLLMEARKGRRRVEDDSTSDAGFAAVQETAQENDGGCELTDTDIAAQALVFFFGGFDSVSSLMSLLGYELTINPDVQEKLQEEIDRTLDACKGDISYESLVKMKYLDAVVSECLRKWPVNMVFERVCTKDFTIDPVRPGEGVVELKVGDVVWFPVGGVQHDSKYYENPDKFDPERFNDENRHLINPYTYFPFGLGPRSCVGSRLAILEVKTFFFHFLSKFDFVVTKKTPIPLKFSNSTFAITAEGGYWIGLKPRVKKE